MGIFYATREQVLTSLEIMQSAYSNSHIDTKIDAASRSIEGFLHRRFYPELRTIRRDWPNSSYAPSWRVYLDSHEMVSLTAVTSGGVTITSDCILRRSDDLAEPPYSILEIDRSTNAAFSGGSSSQESLVISGVFGHRDTGTANAGGALNGAINASVTVVNIKPSNGIYSVGVGSLLLCGTERMTVLDRRMASTSQTISADVASQQSTRTVATAGASTFAIGETILIDSERMQVNDIAGTNLIVTRAYDGTALAAHTSGATIYALRDFMVSRAALGSTAATHADADPVYVHEFPALINQLCVAETLVSLQQSAAAYARMIGSGNASREATGIGLEDLRRQAWNAYGRKSRLRAI